MSLIGFNEEHEQQVSQDFSARRIEKFLQIIDPYTNQKITFSECVHLFSSEMVTLASPESIQMQSSAHSQGQEPELIQMAILEYLSQNNPPVLVNSTTHS